MDCGVGVDSCSFPVWQVGYVMNDGLTQKAPRFPGIHSRGAECELETNQRKDESFLFPLVSECSGLGNVSYTKFQVNSSPLKYEELNLMPFGSNFNLKVAL